MHLYPASTAMRTGVGIVSQRRAFGLSLAALFTIASLPLAAEPDNPTVGVGVKIYVRGTAWPSGGDPAYITLQGTFLPSSPTANDAFANKDAESYSDDAKFAATLGSQGIVRIEPGKTYTVSATTEHVDAPEINIVAPPGYRVIMDNLPRTRRTFGYNIDVVFKVEKVGAKHPGLAGMASGTPGSEIEWRLSLGSLRNGASAGDLTLIDTGTRSDWAPIFTPALLSYEEVSEEVAVYRPNNTIRQIIANQVVVDVVTLPASSYEIRCYHPTQMQGETNPRTFIGQPFAVHRFEQGATATTLKFTREFRNVTHPVSHPPISRREFMVLERSGTWPAFAWTRTGWTGEGQTALSETFVQSGGTTSNRTESVAIRTPGGSAAVNLARNYTVITNLGEVLVSETLGTSTGLTSDFACYTSTAQYGNFGRLKSVTLPGDG